MNVIVKIILSLLIGGSLIYPYLQGTEGPSVLDATFGLGIFWVAIAIATFFGCVALYCRALQTTLRFVKPKNRVANPGSVWLMFLIPYNIIEDFFIISNITLSLREEARENPELTRFGDFGFVIGISWAIAQVMSFIPGVIGHLSGLAGLLLWIIHWGVISRINAVLKCKG